MTIILDGTPVKGIIDTGADVSIIITTVADKMKWKLTNGPNIHGVGGLQLTKRVTSKVIWKDLDGKTGTFEPLIAEVPNMLLGRDILEQMDAVITTDDKAMLDEIIVHDKIGLSGHSPHPQF